MNVIIKYIVIYIALSTLYCTSIFVYSNDSGNDPIKLDHDPQPKNDEQPTHAIEKRNCDFIENVFYTPIKNLLNSCRSMQSGFSDIMNLTKQIIEKMNSTSTNISHSYNLSNISERVNKIINRMIESLKWMFSRIKPASKNEPENKLLNLQNLTASPSPKDKPENPGSALFSSNSLTPYLSTTRMQKNSSILDVGTTYINMIQQRIDEIHNYFRRSISLLSQILKIQNRGNKTGTAGGPMSSAFTDQYNILSNILNNTSTKLQSIPLDIQKSFDVIREELSLPNIIRNKLKMMMHSPTRCSSSMFTNFVSPWKIFIKKFMKKC